MSHDRSDWFIARRDAWKCDGTWKVTNQTSYAFPIDHVIGLTEEAAREIARYENERYPIRNRKSA